MALHPVNDRPEHVDFFRLVRGAKAQVSVPVVFLNEDDSPGLKKGGVLNIVRHEIVEPKLAQGKAEGIFEIDDPNFGNLWTNIPTRAFVECGFAYGDIVRVEVLHGQETVFDQSVLFHKSFGFAKPGEPIIYNNELMKVALAVSCGSFEQTYALGFGASWRVRFTKTV